MEDKCFISHCGFKAEYIYICLSKKKLLNQYCKKHAFCSECRDAKVFGWTCFTVSGKRVQAEKTDVPLLCPFCKRDLLGLILEGGSS